MNGDRHHGRQWHTCTNGQTLDRHTFRAQAADERDLPGHGSWVDIDQVDSDTAPGGNLLLDLRDGLGHALVVVVPTTSKLNFVTSPHGSGHKVPRPSILLILVSTKVWPTEVLANFGPCSFIQSAAYLTACSASRSKISGLYPTSLFVPSIEPAKMTRTPVPSLLRLVNTPRPEIPPGPKSRMCVALGIIVACSQLTGSLQIIRTRAGTTFSVLSLLRSSPELVFCQRFAKRTLRSVYGTRVWSRPVGALTFRSCKLRP
ncbi:beta subunit of fatty acid synthase [Hortaea werneckii]|nr:beta subunit of fatty acid synthase [Hortaea werneckii]